MALLIDLVLTAGFYCFFPLLFAATRHKPITEKKYLIICYLFNFLVVMSALIAIVTYGGGKAKGSIPYYLWTVVFTRVGVSILKRNHVLQKPSNNQTRQSPDSLENKLAAAQIYSTAWFLSVAKEAESETSSANVHTWDDDCLTPLRKEAEMMRKLAQTDDETAACEIVARYVPEIIRALVHYRKIYLFSNMDPSHEEKFEALMRKYCVRPDPDYRLADLDDYDRIDINGWRKRP